MAANSDQEPEDTSHSFGSLDSKAIETLIFDLLRSEGRFVLHKKEGASQGKRFCSATLEIPNSDHKFSVQGRSRKRVSLFFWHIGKTKVRTELMDASGKPGTRLSPSWC